MSTERLTQWHCDRCGKVVLHPSARSWPDDWRTISAEGPGPAGLVQELMHLCDKCSQAFRDFIDD